MTTGNSRSKSFLESALAASRSRGSWNDRFAFWEKPPSDSEEVHIQRSGAIAGCRGTRPSLGVSKQAT